MQVPDRRRRPGNAAARRRPLQAARRRCKGVPLIERVIDNAPTPAASTNSWSSPAMRARASEAFLRASGHARRRWPSRMRAQSATGRWPTASRWSPPRRYLDDQLRPADGRPPVRPSPARRSAGDRRRREAGVILAVDRRLDNPAGRSRRRHPRADRRDAAHPGDRQGPRALRRLRHRRLPGLQGARSRRSAPMSPPAATAASPPACSRLADGTASPAPSTSASASGSMSTTRWLTGTLSRRCRSTPRRSSSRCSLVAKPLTITAAHRTMRRTEDLDGDGCHGGRRDDAPGAVPRHDRRHATGLGGDRRGQRRVQPRPAGPAARLSAPARRGDRAASPSTGWSIRCRPRRGPTAMAATRNMSSAP